RVQVKEVPPGFDPTRAGFQEHELRYDPATGMLTASIRLTDQHLDRVMSAAAGGITGAPGSAVAEEAGVENVRADGRRPGAISEQKAPRPPSAVPPPNRLFPYLLALIGIGTALGAPVLALVKLIAWNTAISMEIAAVCALISAWIVAQTHNALRDRVLTI